MLCHTRSSATHKNVKPSWISWIVNRAPRLIAVARAANTYKRGIIYRLYRCIFILRIYNIDMFMALYGSLYFDTAISLGAVTA